MSRKTIAPAALVALREALTNLYWYKSDLRSFLTNCLADSRLLVTLDWSDYKRNIVGQLVARLEKKQERYQSDLLKLMSEVARVDDLSHLERLDGGAEKVARARDSIAALRKWVAGHSASYKEQLQAEERREQAHQKQKRQTATQEGLERIREEYVGLFKAEDAQNRGYRLERIIRGLFELFDLDPKAAFRVVGEQIDGAFTFEGTDFLSEAKWQKAPVGSGDLDSLAGKLRRKLDNTLGLFLSINGFSQDGVAAHASGRRLLILMDGQDLMAVLDGRIDLVQLLRRKRKHASQTGEIYLTVNQILGSAATLPSP